MQQEFTQLSYRKQRLLGFIEPSLWPILPLLISVIGIPTLFITRELAAIYHPRLFDGTIPTISKAAAYSPASEFFAFFMTAAAICIVLAWPLSFIMNRHRAQRFMASTKSYRLVTSMSGVAVLLGITAGLALGGLAMISLEDDNDAHMLLSKLFFATQVLAFIFDTAVGLWLRRRSKSLLGQPAFSLNFKPWLTVSIFVLVIFFLFMFIAKDANVFSDYMLTRQLYTGAELLMAVLCFLYPSAYYPEARDYYGSPFRMLGSRREPGAYAAE